MNTRLWVETNTNQANQPNIDKALKQKSRRLKIRVIRLIRVRKTSSSSWLQKLTCYQLNSLQL